MSRTIAITSGKGGVGKTNISLNLAISLARKRHRVCLFDADLGLANINILLGTQPKVTLADVVNGESSFEDIMIEYEGVNILPGSSGVEELADLSPSGREQLLQAFASLDEYDFVLFDTSAGISRDVMAFCLSSSEVLLVITPEPTSLTDGYALLKMLLVNGFRGQVKVILNQCDTMETAQSVYRKFKGAVSQHLKSEISALGVVFEDAKVPTSVREQKALLSLFPDSRAARCIEKLAERLVGDTNGDLEQPDIGSFWKKCLGFFSAPLTLKGPHPSGERRKQKMVAETVRAEKGVNAPSQRLRRVEEPEEQRTHGQRRLSVGKNEAESTASLIRSIEAVSDELKELRRTIQRGNGNGTGRIEGRKSALTAPIRLDFEHYLERKLKHAKESEHAE